MKRTTVLAAIFLSTLNSQLSTAVAQGSLTPPGAPGATMKSLDQIQPRSPIASAPFTISQPGSYYLTTNIAVTAGTAIVIATNRVTLDLNGFTISSTEASPTGTGILIGGGQTDITIENGHIKGRVTVSGGVYSGSGFANGIFFSGSPPLNVRVAGVSVSGCLGDGIHLGSINSSVVDSCTVFTVGGYGIAGNLVLRSTAKTCGNVGISCDTASDSTGNSSGSSDGLDATFTASNCNGSSPGGIGVNAPTVVNCYGSSLTGDGIDATTASGCQGTDLAGSGSGIYASTAENCSGSSAVGGYGVFTYYTATGCYGNSGSGIGVSTGTAQNCYGTSSSGTGIACTVAENSFGSSGGGVSTSGILCNSAVNCNGSAGANGIGINASVNAMNSYGYSYSGIGLKTFLATSCVGDTSGGTPYSVTHNVNTYVFGL